MRWVELSWKVVNRTALMQLYHWGGFFFFLTIAPYCLWLTHIKKSIISPYSNKTDRYNFMEKPTCISRAKVLSTSASSAKLKKTCQEFDSWDNNTVLKDIGGSWMNTCIFLLRSRRIYVAVKTCQQLTHKSPCLCTTEQTQYPWLKRRLCSR